MFAVLVLKCGVGVKEALRPNVVRTAFHPITDGRLDIILEIVQSITIHCEPLTYHNRLSYHW